VRRIGLSHALPCLVFLSLSLLVSQKDEFIKALDMKPAFMQSVYRDGTALDDSLEVIWYSSMLTGDVFADLINTGQKQRAR
jgi:hypothetical protein